MTITQVFFYKYFFFLINIDLRIHIDGFFVLLMMIKSTSQNIFLWTQIFYHDKSNTDKENTVINLKTNIIINLKTNDMHVIYRYDDSDNT